MRGGEVGGGYFMGRDPKANGCWKSFRNNVKEDLQIVVCFRVAREVGIPDFHRDKLLTLLY